MTTYINPNQKKIKDALRKHKEELLKFTRQRVSVCTIDEVKNWLIDSRLEDILVKEPKDLVAINTQFFSDLLHYSIDEFNSYIRDIRKRKLDADQTSIRTKYSHLKKELEKIFDYNNYFSVKDSEYSTYNLAKNLDIPTCPYCNRIYTKTVINKKIKGKIKKITRPEFDHWFPKSKYPLLALSFYNLIPSCHTCNSSVKGDSDFTLDTHLHPYVDDNISLQFSYEYDKTLSNHKFKIDYRGDVDGKTQRTAEEFKLEDIYETHKDEINDLLRIRTIYSDSYLLKLSSLLGESVSYEELYRLAFGTHIEESSFERRPLSRMKRDILKELGIIKTKKL